MKVTIWQPVFMTLITIWSLAPSGKSAELLEGNLILLLILLACIVSWFVYFMQKSKKKKLMMKKKTE
ncbi:hypothetical protein ACT3CE_00550 [Marinifilum sp. RC60d5]|uniref:hypothetical protein n=1 Tax=Marinifilum sp. RC60d5 TaxID=3458414 RepID=UPI0040367AFF